MQKTNLFFWLFTIAVCLVLLLPNLVQDGMFMDGMLYACVSKNLSNGIGSFWHPHYSVTLYPFFDQQPPLGFGIQSVFFSLLGDSIYTERIYSFLCALITAYLIAVLWRLFFADRPGIKRFAWLPVLLWITIPVCFWSYSNNMLENTMAIFDLAAIIFITKYLIGSRKTWYLIAAGCFIVLAALTKGIQGTFPLAAVFFGWLVYRNLSFAKMVTLSGLLLLVPVVIISLLFLNPEAYHGLYAYLHHRVMNSIRHVSEVESRFYLAGRLVMELLPSIVLVFIIWITSRKKTVNGYFLHTKRNIFFLLLVGISASFPLMVTMEQRGFYLVTSLPYFATAIAMLAAPGVKRLFDYFTAHHKAGKIFGVCSVLLLCSVILYSVMQFGKTGRDKEMLHDVYLIGKVVPQGTVLGSTRNLWENWTLQEYLVRYFYVCQADTIRSSDKYLLLTSASDIPDSMNVEKVDIPTITYHLYRKKG